MFIYQRTRVGLQVTKSFSPTQSLALSLGNQNKADRALCIKSSDQTVHAACGKLAAVNKETLVGLRSTCFSGTATFSA